MDSSTSQDRLAEALEEARREGVRVIFTDDDGAVVGAVIGTEDLALLDLVDEMVDLRSARDSLAEAEREGLVSLADARDQLGVA